MDDDTQNRCRLILTLPDFNNASEKLEQALSGGDVASVFLHSGISDNAIGEQEFLSLCKKLVPLIQSHGAAAIVGGDTRIAGRAEADGYLIEDGMEALKDACARFSPHKIVGCGNIRERHRALEAGEINPDFMFFGKLDRDIRPEPHKKNLKLGNWWAQMVEIPCAIMGGNSIESTIDVAQSGAEFVVLSKAVFCNEAGPAKAVGKVNELLDEFGPRFDEEQT